MAELMINFTYTQKLAHDTMDTMSHFLAFPKLRGLIGSLSPPSKVTSYWSFSGSLGELSSSW